MGTWDKMLQMLKNPEDRAIIGKALDRELPAVMPKEPLMLPEGTGRNTVPIPMGEPGIIEKGLANEMPSPATNQLLLEPGNGTIELPGHVGVEETGSAIGQPYPEAAETSLSEAIPETTTSAPEKNAFHEKNPYLEEAGSNFDEPTTAKTPSSSSKLSTPAKVAGLGAAGLGLGALAFKGTEGSNPLATPMASAADGNPDQRLTNMSIDPNPASQKPAEVVSHKPIPVKSSSDSAKAALGQPSALAKVTNEDLNQALNFGTSSEQAAALQEVRNRQTMAQLASGLAQAGSLIGAGIARVPVSKEGMAALHEQGKQAGNITSDYLASQENDPKSPQSLALRNVLDKLGVKYKGEPSAAQLKQALPYIFKDQEAKQAQEGRLLQAKMHNDYLRTQKEISSADRAERAEIARQDKLRQQDFVKEKTVAQQLDSVRGNKAIQNDLETVRRVANAKNIFDLYPDKDKIPPEQIQLLKTDLATIMSGGIPGEGLISELSVPTLKGDFAKKVQYFLGHPTGANGADLLKSNEAIFDRLGDEAQTRVYDKYRRTMNTLGQQLPSDVQDRYQTQYLPHDEREANTGLFKFKGLPKKKTPSGPSKIRVTNGLETYDIDPANEAMAQKDGFHRTETK